jgi:uncharacterized membrane protein
MGHRINVSIQRLSLPGCVVAALVLQHRGFGFGRILVILFPIFGALMLVSIFLNPGPRAKGFVEGLKSRFR